VALPPEHAKPIQSVIPPDSFPIRGPPLPVPVPDWPEHAATARTNMVDMHITADHRTAVQAPNSIPRSAAAGARLPQGVNLPASPLLRAENFGSTNPLALDLSFWAFPFLRCEE